MKQQTTIRALVDRNVKRQLVREFLLRETERAFHLHHPTQCARLGGEECTVLWRVRALCEPWRSTLSACGAPVVVSGCDSASLSQSPI